MKVKEKSDIKAVIVKVGLALALSLASFVYSRLRPRRPNNPSPPSSDSGNESDSRGKDERKIPSSNGFAWVPSETLERGKSERNGDNDLVEEFDSSDALKTPPKAFVSDRINNDDQEIGHLRDTIRTLRERERNLEAKLLEFYGLEEQESAVAELRNRLKLNAVEAKLFGLKIESLRAENQRLKSQVADKDKAVAELEASRAKIRLLKEKLRTEAEKNREQILNLKKRVVKFEEDEYKSLASDSYVRSRLKRLRELEGETGELKKSVSVLQLENSDLTRKLESTQILASSVLEDPDADELREVSDGLRKENEALRNEIERLQAYRCSEIEELVYLRWINACLRYELRDYRPGDGKTVVARDLSKTLSPKSEEKAKQLIMEYANTEGLCEREISFMDFEYDQWSSSHNSFTDSADQDESSSSLDNSSTGKRFFAKLMKLARGKEEHESKADGDSLRCSPSLSTLDCGNGAAKKDDKGLADPSDSFSRLASDTARLRDTESGRRNSNAGPSCAYKTFVSFGKEAGSDSTPKDRIFKGSSGRDDRSELLKYAEALKRSRRGSLKLHRKSASYGF